jgi:hypothetical protein
MQTALVLTPQYALHFDLPNHGGLGNPSTNEEVTMAAAKKKAPAKKAAKKKRQEEVAQTFSAETGFGLPLNPRPDSVS